MVGVVLPSERTYPHDAAQNADQVSQEVGVLDHSDLLVQESGPRAQLQVHQLRVCVIHYVFDVHVVLCVGQVGEVALVDDTGGVHSSKRVILLLKGVSEEHF